MLILANTKNTTYNRGQNSQENRSVVFVCAFRGKKTFGEIIGAVTLDVSPKAPLGDMAWVGHTLGYDRYHAWYHMLINYKSVVLLYHRNNFYLVPRMMKLLVPS